MWEKRAPPFSPTPPLLLGSPWFGMRRSPQSLYWPPSIEACRPSEHSCVPWWFVVVRTGPVRTLSHTGITARTPPPLCAHSGILFFTSISTLWNEWSLLSSSLIITVSSQISGFDRGDLLVGSEELPPRFTCGWVGHIPTGLCSFMAPVSTGQGCISHPLWLIHSFKSGVLWKD